MDSLAAAFAQDKGSTAQHPVWDALNKSPVPVEEKNLPDPFAAKPPTKDEIKESIKKMKEKFKDVLVPLRSDGGFMDLKELPVYAAFAQEERHVYFDRNAALARKVLGAVQPHVRLPEPVLLPQVIRYLNAEISALHLPYRVRLLLNDADEASYVAHHFGRFFHVALPDDDDLPKDTRKYSLSQALQKGSLWDIIEGLEFSILPLASCDIFENGLIVIAPNR